MPGIRQPYAFLKASCGKGIGRSGVVSRRKCSSLHQSTPGTWFLRSCRLAAAFGIYLSCFSFENPPFPAGYGFATSKKGPFGRWIRFRGIGQGRKRRPRSGRGAAALRPFWGRRSKEGAEGPLENVKQRPIVFEGAG